MNASELNLIKDLAASGLNGEQIVKVMEHVNAAIDEARIDIQATADQRIDEAVTAERAKLLAAIPVKRTRRAKGAVATTQPAKRKPGRPRKSAAPVATESTNGSAEVEVES